MSEIIIIIKLLVPKSLTQGKLKSSGPHTPQHDIDIKDRIYWTCRSGLPELLFLHDLSPAPRLCQLPSSDGISPDYPETCSHYTLSLFYTILLDLYCGCEGMPNVKHSSDIRGRKNHGEFGSLPDICAAASGEILGHWIWLEVALGLPPIIPARLEVGAVLDGEGVTDILLCSHCLEDYVPRARWGSTKVFLGHLKQWHDNL